MKTHGLFTLDAFLYLDHDPFDHYGPFSSNFLIIKSIFQDLEMSEQEGMNSVINKPVENLILLHAPMTRFIK